MPTGKDGRPRIPGHDHTRCVGQTAGLRAANWGIRQGGPYDRCARMGRGCRYVPCRAWTARYGAFEAELLVSQHCPGD